MKICVFTDSFLPYISGVSFAVLNQVNELATRKNKVSIFRPKPLSHNKKRNCEIHSSVKIHDVPISIPTWTIPNLNIAVPSVVSTYNIVKRIRPDIIHVNTEWGCGWEGVLVAKMLSIPVVGTFHTFYAEPDYLKHFGIPDSKTTQEIMWKYSVFFYNQCQTIISPSKAVQEQLLNKGIYSEPIILSNGIKLPALHPADAIKVLRKRYAIPGPSMIYIGRVSDEKSLDIVVKAFSRILPGMPDCRLIIVGDGPGDAKLDRQIEEQNVQHAVMRLGSMEHDRLINENIPLLGDIFVTASTTENQPISILEAMTFQMPIIGARAKGIPELVKDGVNGALFEPDNVDQLSVIMAKLLREPETLRTMGDESARMVQNHSIQNVAEKLEAIYRETVLDYRRNKREKAYA